MLGRVAAKRSDVSLLFRWVRERHDFSSECLQTCVSKEPLTQSLYTSCICGRWVREVRLRVGGSLTQTNLSTARSIGLRGMVPLWGMLSRNPAENEQYLLKLTESRIAAMRTQMTT